MLQILKALPALEPPAKSIPEVFARTALLRQEFAAYLSSFGQAAWL
jgi:hypothetical protein